MEIHVLPPFMASSPSPSSFLCSKSSCSYEPRHVLPISSHVHHTHHPHPHPLSIAKRGSWWKEAPFPSHPISARPPRLPQVVVRSKFSFGGGGGQEEGADAEGVKKVGAPEQKGLTDSNSDFFVKWTIPWDGETVIVTMTSFGVSFLLTGLGISVLFARLGLKQRQLEFDEQSLLVFLNQLLETIVGTAVINLCLKSYKPFPPELFYYDLRNPFSIRRGWLLWGVVGIFSGAAAVLLAGTLVTYINGAPLPREGQDALVQLLPLIGSSGTSTALLFAVTGVLAPYLEETVFRGFLMTSLTKWMPIPAAVALSAGAFALAHFTPGEIPQLFALGVVLGFSYAKSGNLLTPMIVHGLWNSGVLLLLTFLRLQGYDIREII